MPQDPPSATAGFTAVPTDVMDALLAANLSSREWRVVMAIVRKTFGWGKDVDDITFQQISKLTGVGRSHVSETVRQLAKRKVVLFRDGNHGYLVGINQKTHQWKVSQSRTPVPKRDAKCPKTGRKGVPKQGPQYIPPIDTSNRYRGVSQNGTALPDWLPADAWKDWKEFRKRKAPLTDRAVTLTLNTLGRLRKQGHDPREVIEQSIERGWTGLFPVKGQQTQQRESLEDAAARTWDHVHNDLAED